MSAGLPTSTEPTPEAIKLKTAFVIAVDPDGNVLLERDPKSLTLTIEREATLLEVRRYAADILADLAAQASADYVTNRLMTMGTQPTAE